MLTRRSLLRGMLAGAVAAIARISPLVDEQRLTFRGIPVKLENPMWYSDPSGQLSAAEAREITERMTAAIYKLPHKPGSYYMHRSLYREITGQEYEDRPS